MKFILDEAKFLLKEQPKFFLEERFTLNETVLLEAQATLKQLVIDLNKLDTLLPPLLEVLPVGAGLKIAPETSFEADKVAVEKEIQDNCKEIQDLLKDRRNFKELIDKLRTKATLPEGSFTEEEVKVLQPLCYNIASDGTSIKDRLKGIKSHKGEFVEQIVALQERLPKLIASLNELYKFFKEDYQYKLKQSKISLKVGDTYELLKLIEVTPKPKEAITATFEVGNTTIATVNKKQILTALAVGQTLIKVTVGEQTLKCRCIVEDASTNTNISTQDQIDWKTKLASASEKETVIEEFIYTTWSNPEHAKKVILIKKALLAECEAYGFLNFGDNLNPFILFISNVYLNPAYQMKPQTYSVIHNLVANNVLKGEDLAMKGVMSKGNLVYCKALYALDDGAIKLYLNKQRNLLNAAKKPDTFATNAEMAFNILYSVDQIQTGKATKDATELKLRSMAQIEQLENKWTGMVSKTVDKEIKNTTATNAELLNQIEDKNTAVNMLVALVFKFSSNENITNAVRACKEAREALSKVTTGTDIQKLMASIERRFKLEHIKADQALKLIKSILEADKFNFTME